MSIKNGVIRVEIAAGRTNIKSQQLLGLYSVVSELNKTHTRMREV